MGKALVLTLGGVLTAILNVLCADKLKSWIAWFTTQLLDLAVQRLPENQRERFAEEWASHLNDISGDIGKVVFARGCVSAAHKMPSSSNVGSEDHGEDRRAVVPATRRAVRPFPAVKDLPIFEGVTPAEFALIISAAREKHFSDGEIIYKQSSPVREVALLLCGSIELTFFHWITGQESAQGTIWPGALVNNHDGTTRAVEACWILVWDQPEFTKLRARIPTFSRNSLMASMHPREALYPKLREQRKLIEQRMALNLGVRGEVFLSRDSYNTVFGWLLVGAVALGIWEIVKHVYK